MSKSQQTQQTVRFKSHELEITEKQSERQKYAKNALKHNRRNQTLEERSGYFK